MNRTYTTIVRYYFIDICIALALLLLYLWITFLSKDPIFLFSGAFYLTAVYFISNFIDKEHKRYFFRIVCFFVGFYSIYATVTHFVFIDDPFKDYFLAPDQLTFFRDAVDNSHLSLKQIWISAFDNKIGYTGSGYPLFTAYTGTLQKIINSPDSYGLLFQKLNVAFWGSFIPGIVYLLCTKITRRRKAFKAALFYGLLSVNFIYSVILLRDIHIALLYSVALYLVIKGDPKAKNFLLLLLLGLMAYYIRFENGLFFLLFVGIWVYKTGFQNKLIFAVGLTVIVGIIWFIGGTNIIYDIALDRIQTSSNKIANRADQGSLYVQLMNLPRPFNYIGVTAYGQIRPFPFWHIFEVKTNYLRSIFYLPLALSGLFWFSVWMRIIRNFRQLIDFYKKYKFTIIAVVLYLMILSTAESLARRLMAVYPLIFMAFIYISERIFTVKELLINIPVYSLLLIIYFFL